MVGCSCQVDILTVDSQYDINRVSNVKNTWEHGETILLSMYAVLLASVTLAPPTSMAHLRHLL